MKDMEELRKPRGNRWTPTAPKIIGKKFGKLFIRKCERDGQSVSVLADCDCGKSVVVKAYAVFAGETKSCGCSTREFLAMRAKHGASRRGKVTPEYRVWLQIIGRCCNPNNKNYVHYGARGITVCERWRSFERFLEDMGARPDRSLTIERPLDAHSV
jgi:hypothetical protein